MSKVFFLSFSLIIAVSASAESLILDSRHSDTSPSYAEIKVDYRLRNAGSSAVNISGKTLVYTIRDQATADQFHSDVWWYSCGSNSDVSISVVQPEASSDTRQVLITFAAGAVPAAGDCQLQTRFYKENWAANNESDDPSYLANTTFTENGTLYFLNESPSQGSSSSQVVTSSSSQDVYPNTVILGAPNTDQTLTLVTGSKVIIKGFPTDWEPNTLSLHFVPEPNQTMDC